MIDEIIVPSYTYSASALAAIHCGATVLLTMIRARLVEIPWNQLKEK